MRVLVVEDEEVMAEVVAIGLRREGMAVDVALAVRGYLVASRGRTQLCELQAQSYPPQCGGRSMVLEGYDATSLAAPRRKEACGGRRTTSCSSSSGADRASSWSVP